MKLNLKYGHAEHSDAFLNETLQNILEANTLMSVATIKDGKSYSNTAYYCFNDKLDLFFLSNPASQHCLNLQVNRSAALSIYDSHQEWDKPKKGIQLFASSELAQGLTLLEGGKLYMQRFSGLKKWIAHIDDLAKNIIHSKLYVLQVEEIKLFDEDVLGEEVFLNLKPIRD